MPWIGDLNTNFRDYEAGNWVRVSKKSYDLTWSARKARLVQLLTRDVRCSLISVQECDVQMMEDTCAGIEKCNGSVWKHLGGDNYFTGRFDGDAQDKNGWLYDSAKWTWQDFTNHTLCGSGTRALLGATWTYLPTGDSLRVYTTHLNSGDPEGRPAQMADARAVMEREACLFMGDLNAMSLRVDSALTLDQQGPRAQLVGAGWTEAPYAAYPAETFNDYGRGSPARIDYVGLSPLAIAAGISFTGKAEIVSGLNPASGSGAAYASDHNAIRALVSI